MLHNAAAHETCAGACVICCTVGNLTSYICRPWCSTPLVCFSLKFGARLVPPPKKVDTDACKERSVKGFPKIIWVYTQLAYLTEWSHVCFFGEGACILFSEPVLSHFNPPALPPHPRAEEKERPPRQPTPPWGAMFLRLSCTFTENRLWVEESFLSGRQRVWLRRSQQRRQFC